MDPKTKLVVFGGLGDWVPPGGNGDNKTPTPPVTAFYWLLDLHYMAEMAIGLGDAFVFFLIPLVMPVLLGQSPVCRGGECDNRTTPVC